MCLFRGDVVNRHLVLMCCTVRRSGTDGGERARCQVVDACPGRVHIRQARRACSHHSHRRRTALSRYAMLSDLRPQPSEFYKELY